jgi:hypothetical protein
VKVTKGDKQVIKRTSIEKLINRTDKHQYIKRHGHLFGKKHDCYFNPYTNSKANEKNFKRIDRPKGVQVGQGEFLIHEAMGLRDDYDFFLNIRVCMLSFYYHFY